MSPLAPIVVILLFAATVEGLTEYLTAPIAGLKAYAAYVAMLLGVAIAVSFGLDLFALIGVPETTVLAHIAALVLTGIAIGRGSNYVNDLIDTARALGGQGGASLPPILRIVQPASPPKTS